MIDTFEFSSHNSCLDELLLVVDLGIEVIVVTDQGSAFEWERGLDVALLALLDLIVQFLPFLVKSRTIFLVLSA